MMAKREQEAARPKTEPQQPKEAHRSRRDVPKGRVACVRKTVVSTPAAAFCLVGPRRARPFDVVPADALIDFERVRHRIV